MSFHNWQFGDIRLTRVNRTHFCCWCKCCIRTLPELPAQVVFVSRPVDIIAGTIVVPPAVVLGDDDAIDAAAVANREFVLSGAGSVVLVSCCFLT